MHRSRPAAFFLAAACWLSASAAKGLPAQRVLRLGEGVLRQKAIEAKRPTYPIAAMQKGAQGVSVTQMMIDTQGRTVEAKVLQSPHQSISQELGTTLSSWVFRVTTVAGRPLPVTGKLIYYFVLEERQGCVLSPDEMLEAKRQAAQSDGKGICEYFESRQSQADRGC